MNNILGGPYSRLMNNLREKRAFTYGAYSQLNPDEHISQFTASTSVRNVVTDSAVAQMVLELYRMRAGQPEATELQRAKSMVSGGFARSLENPGTVALFAINTARFKLPKDYYANYLKNVAAVTPEAVHKAAQKYITPTSAYVLAVGNADYIERRLARFDADGKLEYYDANGEKVDRASLEVPAGMTAEKVLDSYIQALGGRENLQKIKDITITSNITSPAATLYLTHLQKGNDKILQSLQYGSNEVQRTVINGTKGKAAGSGQTRTLTPDEIREHKLKLGYTNVLNIDKMGIKKNLLGMERLNGRAAYRVELTMPNGKRTIYYIDSENGLKLREMEIEQTTIGNATQTTDFGDYREVNGVKFPHRQLLYAGQQGVLTEVQKIELNKNLPDERFKL
jgi:zinc protease